MICSLRRNSRLRHVLLSQLPAQESAELDWLVTERGRRHTPSISRTVSDLSLPTRLRGTSDWAPPRAQIIYHMHLPATRKVGKFLSTHDSFFSLMAHFFLYLYLADSSLSLMAHLFFPSMIFCGEAAKKQV